MKQSSFKEEQKKSEIKEEKDQLLIKLPHQSLETTSPKKLDLWSDFVEYMNSITMSENL